MLSAVGTVAFPSVASAVSRSVEYGRAGDVDTYVVRGWWSYSGNTLQVPGRNVYRTRGTRRARVSASGTQRICVTYKLYTFTAGYYDPAWPLDAQQRWCVRVDPGDHGTFPDWNYAAQPYVGWNVEIVATWRRTGGRRLGKAVYDYDDPDADYECQTIKCSTFEGYDGVATMMFDL